MSFLSVAILADDLTGAADTAAAFARPGAPVPISLDLYPPPGWQESPVFAITTESRGCPPEEAYGIVSNAIQGLIQTGAGLVYKKVDSNLRGNIGPELAAVREALGRPIVLAPAFPARGRTTVSGIALVNGVPVAETHMGKDPQAPVTHSNIAELIRSQHAGLAVASVSLEDLRAGRFDPPSARDAAIVLVDAETDADLTLIAQLALAASPPPVLSGSAGLAAAVAARVLGPPARPTWPEQERGPVLAVLASSSPHLAQQVEAAREAGTTVVGVVCTSFSWEDALVPDLSYAIEGALAELKANRDVVVVATGPLPDAPRPVDLVVEHLAHLAFVVAKRGRPAGLLLGGGATAHALLRALGARAIDVDDEPLPGLTAGALVGGDFAGRPVVLKPGAAGDRAAVANLLRYLRRRAAARGE